MLKRLSDDELRILVSLINVEDKDSLDESLSLHSDSSEVNISSTRTVKLTAKQLRSARRKATRLHKKAKLNNPAMIQCHKSPYRFGYSIKHCNAIDSADYREKRRSLDKLTGFDSIFRDGSITSYDDADYDDYDYYLEYFDQVEYNDFDDFDDFSVYSRDYNDFESDSVKELMDNLYSYFNDVPKSREEVYHEENSSESNSKNGFYCGEDFLENQSEVGCEDGIGDYFDDCMATCEIYAKHSDPKHKRSARRKATYFHKKAKLNNPAIIQCHKSPYRFGYSIKHCNAINSMEYREKKYNEIDA